MGRNREERAGPRRVRERLLGGTTPALCAICDRRALLQEAVMI